METWLTVCSDTIVMEGTLCQTTFQKLALTVVLAFWQTHTGRTAGRTALHRTVKCPGSFGTSVFHPLISHKAHFNVIHTVYGCLAGLAAASLGILWWKRTVGRTGGLLQHVSDILRKFSGAWGRVRCAKWKNSAWTFGSFLRFPRCIYLPLSNALWTKLVMEGFSCTVAKRQQPLCRCVGVWDLNCW